MKIGKLSNADIKSIWPHEAHNFTPWLAEKENLNMLGEEIGIDLTLIKTEAEIGNFKVDLYCEETNSENKVIIENQYEFSDHKHLGQLITYAAGLNAKTIIWLLEQVRDEHKAAIDWLNDHMDDINFFIVRIEIWKIGDSDPAPKFSIVAEPNTWTRGVHVGEKHIDFSSSQALRLEFWSEFRENCKNKYPAWRPHKPSTRYYYDVHVGGKTKFVGISFNSKNKTKSTYLWLAEDIDDKPMFDFLYSKKSEIEDKFGSELDWSNYKSDSRAKKSSSISFYANGNIEDKPAWPEYRNWFQEQIKKFKEVFEPYIQQFESMKNH